MANKISFLKKNHEVQELITINGVHFCFEVKRKKLQYVEKDFSLIFQAYYNYLEQKYKHSVSDVISPVAETYLKLLSAYNTEKLLFKIIAHFKSFDNPKFKTEIEQAKIEFLSGTENIISLYNSNNLLITSDKLDKFETNDEFRSNIGTFVIFEVRPEFWKYDTCFNYDKETDLAKVRALLATELCK